MTEDYPASSTEPACSRPVDAMTTDYRALCEKLVGTWDSRHDLRFIDWIDSITDIVARARALLAQPEPQSSADGEVAELAAELRHFVAGYQQIRGLDPEHVYSIHRGSAMEAHLRVSRLSRIAELLERLASDNAGLEAAAESAYLDNLSLLNSQND